MKANERDSRTEQERFIDRMLKEILGGQRNPGDRLPTESELAAQYDLRKTNVHLALKELERLGFLEIVPRHATYVAPYWERANLETLAVIMTHGVTPHPELVDAFMELREMVALGWFCWVGRRPNAAQMQKLYGLLAQMDAIAYVPDGDKAAFLELLNAFLVCMFRESDNMIFRVMLRSTRELAHVAYYMVAYTLDMQELCRVYRAVLDGLTDGCVPEAIACWSAWSDRVTLRYREALEQLQSAGPAAAPAGAKATRFFDKPAAPAGRNVPPGQSFFLRCGCVRRADVLKSGNNNERERAHEADIYPRRSRGDRQLHPARDRRALRSGRLRHGAGARPV